MGNWNKTCGLSKLHIFPGQQVYGVVLINDQFNRGWYESTAMYRPIPIAFKTEHNNDHRSTKATGAAVSLIAETLRTKLGENLQRDHHNNNTAVTLDRLNVASVLEAVDNHQLQITNQYGQLVNVDVVLFRTDFVDRLLETYRVERYVQQHLATSEHDNDCVQHTFNDIVARIPQYIVMCRILLSDIYPAARIFGRPVWLDGKHSRYQLDQLDHLDPIHTIIELTEIVSYGKFDSTVDVEAAIIHAINTNDDDLAAELIRDVLLVVFLDRFMENTRMMWSPGGHEGNQQCDVRPYITYAETILDVIQQETQHRSTHGITN